MPDYELFAPDDATMRNALSLLGMTQKDGRRGTVRYVMNYYGTKYVAGVAQPGVFAIVRWVPASVIGNAFPPTGITLPVGVIATTPLPANTGAMFFG
jgi:hypothetical protein